MTNLPRAIRRILVASVGLAALACTATALERTEWSTQQTFAVDRAAVLKLELPPSTLDAARPGLEDLRVLDGTGREVPYLVEVAAPITPPSTHTPRTFRSTLTATATEVLLETGTRTALSGVTLATPAMAFLKAVTIEASDDREHWRTLRSGAAVFRQAGAEQLTIELNAPPAAFLRLTVDDTRSRPVPFTGATLLMAPAQEPAPEAPVAAARITRREEFAGESVLTLDLGARNLPLSSVEFSARDAVFARKIRIAVREVRDETPVERTLARGTLFRMAVEGGPASAELKVPVSATAPTRELIVHIENGDSPPLSVEGVKVAQRPVWLLIAAPAPGTYTLLTGNPEASAPRYDLSRFASGLASLPPSPVPIGAPQPNPGYQRRSPLPDTPTPGAPIDTSAWTYHKTVSFQNGGVQQLELDPEVLAASCNQRGDLRLVRDGVQIPYVLEVPNVSRALPLVLAPANDPKRPTFSRWSLALPRRGVPLNRLTLTAATAVFQRRVRLYESVTDDRAGTYERALAAADWNRRPGQDGTLTLLLPVAPLTDTLSVEIENGDNPGLALTKAEGAYPVIRLLFRAEPGPLALYYGNETAFAPRYDLALLAAQLVAAERHTATLGHEESQARSGWAGMATTRAGLIFWGALALVVIALLAVVAKLLPKPPTA